MHLNLNVVGHVPRHWYLVSAGIQYANGMQHEVIQQQDVIGRQNIGQCVGERERSIRMQKNGSKRLGQSCYKELKAAVLCDWEIRELLGERGWKIIQRLEVAISHPRWDLRNRNLNGNIFLTRGQTFLGEKELFPNNATSFSAWKEGVYFACFQSFN